MYFPKDTTEEIRVGSLVSFGDSGLRPVRNDSLDRIVGVAKRNDTLADSGGAGTPVDVPIEAMVEWDVDVDSDAGATGIVGYISVDTAGGNSVNAGDSNATRVDISDTSAANFFVTKILSTTKVRGIISKSAGVRTFDSLDTTG